MSLKQENNQITNCKVQTFYVPLLSGWILSQLFPFRVCKCASFKAWLNSSCSPPPTAPQHKCEQQHEAVQLHKTIMLQRILCHCRTKPRGSLRPACATKTWAGSMQIRVEVCCQQKEGPNLASSILWNSHLWWRIPPRPDFTGRPSPCHSNWLSNHNDGCFPGVRACGSGRSRPDTECGRN